MRLRPCFSISISRLLMVDSETSDSGDLNHQKVHIYSFKLRAAMLHTGLDCLLFGVSDGTVQKEQLGLCVLLEVCS